MRHRLIYLLFLAVILVPNVWAQGDLPDKSFLPFAKDLQADGVLASKKQLPIMIMFIADDCPFCATAKEEFIKPMIISGEYDDKVIIRLVEIDSTETLIGFQGDQLTMETFAKTQKVRFTPYVVFFDSKGNNLVEPIVGISNKDYYGMFLDDAIENAGKKLKK